MKKPKIISVPRDKGWKNLSRPNRELTVDEILRMVERDKGKK